MTSDKNFDPWGNPQGGNKKPKSSGNGGAGGNNNSNKNDPDLEEALRKFKKATENILGKRKNGNGDNNIPFALIGGALFAFLIIYSSIFFVGSGEKAVVLRLGEYNRTLGQGINFKFPNPIETIQSRNVENTNKVFVGQGNDEFLMVTGDENIVVVEFVVRWNIKNLNDFLFNSATPENTAKNAAESAMREIIGSMPMQFALGDGEGRTKIVDQAQALLQQMLDSYKSGISVVAIDLNRIDVPSDVVEAQIDVQNAKTEQEKVKNQAEAYRNDIIPRARGDAAKLLEEAEGYKQAILSKAKGDTSRFLAVYNQYKQAEGVTRDRIYLETMQEVMQGTNKIIIDSDKAMPYLPLNDLKTGNKNAQ